MGRVTRLLGAAGVTLSLLAAPALTPVADAAPSVNGVKVGITEFKFKPQTVTITTNQKVYWVNRGTVTHTTTSDPVGGAWNATLDPGERFQKQFTGVTGTFTYHCAIHPQMTGTVIVNPPAT